MNSQVNTILQTLTNEYSHFCLNYAISGKLLSLIQLLQQLRTVENHVKKIKVLVTMFSSSFTGSNQNGGKKKVGEAKANLSFSSKVNLLKFLLRVMDFFNPVPIIKKEM